MNISFERATLADVDTLIDIRNKSFYADFVKYGECPGYNSSRESMTTSISSRISYKILCDNVAVGNITIRDDGNGNYFLGAICVIPGYENNGIGQLAMRFIDEQLPDAKHWALETPADKLRNHYFYKKHGYEITKEYDVGSVRICYFERWV